ncbi:LamG domain-containing protein [Aestuariibacter halophilus]|uniref:LamG domain-containing protein n=1 Tax=Fluctibacter halophilus TaxID=226011 RepID=A0ABS8GAN3_9ALTE|nr:LamG domain-containing protein [Aestuariibacter halophilus]MCC2617647.1 LamG domain-containing protein [Aestuariibacter halophilus]
MRTVLAVLMVMLSGWQSALAQSCQVNFPDGLSTTGTGAIHFGYNARLIGSPDNILDTNNITQNAGSTRYTCTTADCSAAVTGGLNSFSPGPFQTHASAVDAYIGNNRAAQFGSYDYSAYRNVATGQKTALYFSANHTTYYFNSLYIGYQSIVYLRAGQTYWFNDLSMSSEVVFNVVGTGTATVFVNNSTLTLPFATRINSSNYFADGDASKLVLYTYGNLTMNNLATVSGLVYSQGAANLVSASYLSGALTAGSATLNSESIVKYQPAAVSGANYGALCIAQTSLVARYDFEEADWLGAGSVLDSSGNDNHGSPVGGVSPVQYSGGTCSVLSVPSNTTTTQDAVDSQVDINDVGNTGSISFWYRSQLAWSNSTARQLFDASNQVPDLDKHFYLSLAGGVLEFGIEDDLDRGVFARLTGLSFAAQEWVLITAVWDLPNRRIQLYANRPGTNRTTTVSDSNLTNVLGDMSTLYWGDNRSGYFVQRSTDNSANGEFDEARIYNYVRSSSEIQADASNPPSCTDPLPAPVAHWPMDVCSVDGSVGEIEDVIGSADGQTVDGATISSSGRYCQSGEFDGTGQHILIPHNAVFALPQGSISLWLKTPDLTHNNDYSTGGQGIFSKDSTGTDFGGYHLGFWLDGNGAAVVRHQDDADNSYIIYSNNGVLQSEQWHHWVYTFGPAGMQLYIDGNLVGSVSGFTGGLVSNPEPVVLGSNGWQTGNGEASPADLRDHFLGQLDDVRLYDQQLTVDQVQSLRALSPYDCLVCQQTDELIAHWPLDLCSVDGSSDEVTDIVSAYHGQTVGGASLNQDGKYCQSGVLDGDTGHLLMPYQGAYETPNGAISLWFNSADVTFNSHTGQGGQALFSRDADTFGGGGHLTIWVQNNGAIRVRHQSDNTSNDISVSNLVQSNRWYHLVYSWGVRGMELYLDGELVGSKASFRGGLEGNQEDIVFGANAWTTQNNNKNTPDLRDFFYGELDDIRFFASQISADKVTALYQQPSYSCINCDTDVLALYGFEQDSWSGTRPILDTSGNTRDGSNLGDVSPLFPSQQVACQVMDVPANSDTTVDAMDTHIDINDQGGRGTLSFWYRSALDWSDSTARQLLDASSDVTSKYFYLTLAGGELEFALEDSDDADAQLNAGGLTYAAGEWVHIAIAWDLTTDSMWLFVNGALLAQNTSLGLNGTLGDVDTVYIGDSRSSYVRSLGTHHSAEGEFDEVRFYAFAQDATQVTEDMDAAEPCALVDHFEILHDGIGLTCEAESFTVRACADADCDTLFESSVNVTLAPFNQVLSFSSGQATVLVNHDVAETLELGLSSTSPAAFTVPGYQCHKGAVQSCRFEFTDAAFEWFSQTPGQPLGDQVAETPFDGVSLRAVKDEQGVCTALVEGSHTVTLTQQCSDPDVCQTPLTVNGVALADANPVSLTFDSNGYADVTGLAYADAGEISLAASTDIATDTGNVTIESGVSRFVVYPASLDISQTVAANGSVAGEPFTLVIQAKGSDGSVLPNYRPGQLQLKLQQDIGGLLPGKLNIGTLVTSSASPAWQDVALAFSDGEYRNGSATYNEADTLQLSVQDADYHGHLIGGAPASQTLGRFVPAYFSAAWRASNADRHPSLVPYCDVSNSFSYYGQSIGLSATPKLVMLAKNAAGEQMGNYRDSRNDWDWAKNASAAQILWQDDTPKLTEQGEVDPAGWQVGFASTPSFSFTEPTGRFGTLVITMDDARISYAQPVQPLPPHDGEVTLTWSKEMLTDDRFDPANPICYHGQGGDYTTDACQGFSPASAFTGTELRSGRLVLDNAYGPETRDLLVPLRIEHRIDQSWQLNTDEQCSALAWTAAQYRMSEPPGTSDYRDVSAWTSVDLARTDLRLYNGQSVAQQGIHVNHPVVAGVPQQGQALLSINPYADGSETWDDYLNFDWNGDGMICNHSTQPGCSSETIDRPSALLSFGQYRGNDRVIHWRETF